MSQALRSLSVACPALRKDTDIMQLSLPLTKTMCPSEIYGTNCSSKALKEKKFKNLQELPKLV